MSLLAWIILGLISGFIASKIVNKAGEGFLLDIVLGIIGAVAGGWLFNTFGMPGVAGLNLYSLFIAVFGAALLLSCLPRAFTWRSLGDVCRQPHKEHESNQTWPHSLMPDSCTGAS
jgi:uncharacterized membrane protein YeaQ/YmgE (transglycosylase-associated protein family)